MFKENQENATVLVLDDERNIVTVLKAILEKRNFQVDGFTDPREALDALRSRRYDAARAKRRCPHGGTVDAADSKSVVRKDVLVQVRRGAPWRRATRACACPARAAWSGAARACAPALRLPRLRACFAFPLRLIMGLALTYRIVSRSCYLTD